MNTEHNKETDNYYRIISKPIHDYDYNYNLWLDKDGFHIVLYLTNGKENKIIKKLLSTRDLYVARKRRDKILKQLEGKEIFL